MQNNVIRIIESKYRIIVYILLLLGFIVRLYKIEIPLADWHSFRQADTAAVSRVYLEEGINLLYPKYYDISRVQSGKFNKNGYRFVEFPIFNALHASLYKAIPLIGFEQWGRLVTVFASLVASVFVLMIVNNIYGRFISILALIFFLFLPYNIYFSRVILPDPLSLTFAIMSVFFGLKYFESKRDKFYIISALSLSLGVLVKPYVIFYCLSTILVLYEPGSIKKVLLNRKIILYIIIISTPFILWRLWMSQFPEGIPFWKWTMNGDGIRFRPAFFRWIFGERIGYLILGIWGLIPFGQALIYLEKKKDFLINTLIVAGLTYLCLFATANVRHDYYQILIIPIISILLAKGVSVMWNYSTGKIPRLLFTFFCLGLAFIVSGTQVREFYKVNHPEIIDAGRAVDRLVPKDAIVIASYNGDTAFLYQTKRKGYPVVELPIDELIREGAQYYTSVNLNDSQTIEFMKRFQILEKASSYVILKLI